MIRKSFKMKLYPGMEREYEQRYNALWPKMKELIREHGGQNYSIFLDRDTDTLYGYLELEDEQKWNKVAETAICKKWWVYMSDIMETNPDHSPVTIELVELFHLD